jgi:hypothetical protein
MYMTYDLPVAVLILPDDVLVYQFISYFLLQPYDERGGRGCSDSSLRFISDEPRC